MRLKKRQGEKSNLFASLRFCLFRAGDEKKIEKREKFLQCNVNVLAS